MNVGVVSNLIDTYSSMLISASKTPPYSDVGKILEKFSDEVSCLVEVEGEVLFYFNDCFCNKNWFNYDLWFIVAIEHPSQKYIEYLLKILDESDVEAIQWKALDVLANMPESISESAVSSLIKLIQSKNHVWSDEVIKKFFETLVFIGSDAGISFISKACELQNQRINIAARYWFERLSEEE